LSPGPPGTTKHKKSRGPSLPKRLINHKTDRPEKASKNKRLLLFFKRPLFRIEKEMFRCATLLSCTGRLWYVPESPF
jgi:hypothetical protein